MTKEEFLREATLAGDNAAGNIHTPVRYSGYMQSGLSWQWVELLTTGLTREHYTKEGARIPLVVFAVMTTQESGEDVSKVGDVWHTWTRRQTFDITPLYNGNNPECRANTGTSCDVQDNGIGITLRNGRYFFVPYSLITDVYSCNMPEYNLPADWGYWEDYRPC